MPFSFKIFILILVFLSLVSFTSLSFFLSRGQPLSESGRCLARSLEKERVVIGNAVFEVEVARTPEARRCGLSFRDGLDIERGMLFVFEEPGEHGIWMKDMRFPIDIVWLSKDLRVVHIAENAQPDSYPQIFTPPEEALYVLEVLAGATAQYDISTSAMAAIK